MKRLTAVSLALILLFSLFSCEPPEVKVSAIILNSASLEMAEGETFKLNATVSPDNATDKTVIWSSSDASIANVEDGMVTAVKAGTATITVSSRDGGAKASCTVTITSREIAVERVTLSRTELDIAVGSTFSIKATIEPENATDKVVQWTTNNPAVATVEDGKITGVGPGAASITATAGGKNASCTVTVKEATIPVRSIKLDQTSLSLLEGESAVLTATVSPDDATDKTVTWTSSDSRIATVFGGTVTGVAPGKVTITATAGNAAAACEVQIVARIPVEKVVLDCKTLDIALGQTDTLVATVFPDNATDKTVIWASSDDEVVSVRNGVINGVALGKATITATSGDKFASCAVTVHAVEIDSITLDRTSIALNPKEEEKLTVTFHPANATDKTVVWSSTDDAVAKVVDGTVTAVSPGIAVIIARAGKSTAECKVKVNNDNYLTISNLTNAEGTLTLKKNGTSVPAITLEYSTDNGHTWSELKDIKDTQTISIPAKGSVILSGENPTYCRTVNSGRNWWSISADVTHTVSGDLMTISSDTDEIHNKFQFFKLFSGDTKLKSAQSLKLTAKVLAERCYLSMFEGCTSLENAPVLSATTLASGCYSSMFSGCKALTRAPKLEATTLTPYCYENMFEGCTSLKDAPELPAGKLALSCYAKMFKGCTALVTAPALPAIALAGMCYDSMFMNCSSLKNAPRLIARELAAGCYTAMFNSCTSLEKAPDLPATRLQDMCYLQMFANCTALTSAPALPATTLASSCYSHMFALCTSLTESPVLPAETLVKNCYDQMFSGCSNLSKITCLAKNISAANCTIGWTTAVALTGKFIKAAGMTGWTFGGSGIPEGWTVDEFDDENE